MWRLRPLQERNYDQRVDALAQRLKNMAPRMPVKDCTLEMEAKLEKIMGGMGEMVGRFDTELMKVGEEIEKVRRQLERGGLRREGMATTADPELSQCHKTFMVLFEQEMNRRRQQQLTLTKSIEQDFNQLLGKVVSDLTNTRQSSVEQSKKHLSDATRYYELLQQQKSHRQQDDRDVLEGLSVQCQIVERQVTALIEESEEFYTGGEEMLKEVVAKVGEQLELERMDRRRVEEQIAVLIGELYEKVPEG